MYEQNRLKLKNKLEKIFELYWIIKKARENIDERKAQYIVERFSEIFGEKTGFKALDERCAKTLLKSQELLAPLWIKDVPLHNNPAELDIRSKVIKRKVSMFNKTMKGARAWDIYLSLKESCRKNEVNFYKYVRDRFYLANTPSLTQIVFST